MRYIPDDFRHEHSLVFEMGDGVVVFNSCSHAGADNIINEVMKAYPGKRIIAMIGGFHLFNKSDEYVRAFARRVGDTGVDVFCKCKFPKVASKNGEICISVLEKVAGCAA